MFFLFSTKLSTTVGSARVVVSPNWSYSFAAIFLSILLIILPDLVFGKAGANWIKSGVAIGQDLIELQKILNFEPAGFIDLGDIARSKGLPHHGLRGLAAYLLKFRISKSGRTSNWSANQLTKKQIKYAATDAWVGRELYLKYKQIKVI